MPFLTRIAWTGLSRNRFLRAPCSGGTDVPPGACIAPWRLCLRPVIPGKSNRKKYPPRR
jgi:hypothetical protein